MQYIVRPASDGSMSTPHHCIEVVIQSLKVRPNCLQLHYVMYLISLPFFPGLPTIKTTEKREKGRKRRRRRRWKTGGIQCLVLKSSPSYSATDFNKLTRPQKVLGLFFFNTSSPIWKTLHLTEFCLSSNFLFSSQGWRQLFQVSSKSNCMLSHFSPI